MIKYPSHSSSDPVAKEYTGVHKVLILDIIFKKKEKSALPITSGTKILQKFVAVMKL